MITITIVISTPLTIAITPRSGSGPGPRSRSFPSHSIRRGGSKWWTVTPRSTPVRPSSSRRGMHVGRMMTSATAFLIDCTHCTTTDASILEMIDVHVHICSCVCGVGVKIGLGVRRGDATADATGGSVIVVCIGDFTPEFVQYWHDWIGLDWIGSDWIGSECNS